MNLTIIIPAYNAERYISSSLDSVVNCTDPNLEILIINDGSKDKTADIIRDYTLRDKRIKLINQKNQGVSVARNTGIDNATNDFIMFLDSDDLLVDLWWNIISSDYQNYDITIFDYIKVSNKQLILNNYKFQNGTVSTEDLLREYILSDRLNPCWGKIIKTNYLKKNDISFPHGVSIGEDAIFEGKIIRNDPQALYINRPIYKYVDNITSASHKNIDSLSDLNELISLKLLLLNLNNQNLIEDYYKKAFGDLVSKLRYSTSNYRNYKLLCNSIDDYDAIYRVINHAFTNLDFRRRKQLKLLKNHLYKRLYFELNIERKLLHE